MFVKIVALLLLFAVAAQASGVEVWTDATLDAEMAKGPALVEL